MLINNIDEIKRKLRSLKKLEMKIRFGYLPGTENMVDNAKGKSLVWNNFFDVNSTSNAKSRYSLEAIALMSKDEFKSIINEYFFSVYYQYYIENGIVNFQLYNPEILNWMGLPPNSGIDEIKKRFRELAKEYHPDTGGDSEKFIELMENYEKLVE